jgi:CBS domain containing-hemolysin-like protein
LESKHSRLPVYQNNIDHIEGFIYIKDLLPYYIKKRENQSKSLDDFNIRKILRPAIFVPESKKIDEMFREFQKKNIHIAIVVDEFGGTAGLVTMEDILAEVMSKLSYSDDSTEYYKKIDEDTLIVDAKIPIDDLEEILSTQLKSEEDDYDTLSGFLLEKFGDLPDVNSYVEVKNLRFEIKDASETQIKKVLIKKLNDEKV